MHRGEGFLRTFSKPFVKLVFAAMFKAPGMEMTQCTGSQCRNWVMLQSFKRAAPMARTAAHDGVGLTGHEKHIFGGCAQVLRMNLASTSSRVSIG
jgi:hypothetical protein